MRWDRSISSSWVSPTPEGIDAVSLGVRGSHDSDVVGSKLWHVQLQTAFLTSWKQQLNRSVPPHNTKLPTILRRREALRRKISGIAGCRVLLVLRSGHGPVPRRGRCPLLPRLALPRSAGLLEKWLLGCYLAQLCNSL